MVTIESLKIDPRVAHKILAFLNRAQTATDISDGLIQDDPENGSGGYVIGKLVAQRILNRRGQLPDDRFSSIYQLESIPGLGEDKLHDLVFTLSRPDAELFREMMYLDVISENWDLRHFTFLIESEAEFHEICHNEAHFKYYIGRQAGRIARIRNNSFFAKLEARREARRSLVETYPDAHLASYAWALWFYKFDMDNWFNFDAVQKTIEDCLGYYTMPGDHTELRFLKGFRNEGLLANPLTVSDLPVWLNHAEQSVTIWVAELRD